MTYGKSFSCCPIHHSPFTIHLRIKIQIGEFTLMSTQKAVTPENCMKLGLGFMASKTLLSAIELGLFTTLADGPMTAEQLNVKLSLHPRSARDFFDALVALGMLER